MNARNHANYEVRARIIKAMAHPTRLFIVDELSKRGERCVWELTQMVGADMSTVSRHLAVLKAAGLVMDDKRGMQVYYRAGVGCISQFLECVESLMKYHMEEQRELLTS